MTTEAINYADKGCAPDLPSCLECPLDTCRLDDPLAPDRWRRANRAALVEGMTAKWAAQRLGISRRSIPRMRQRVIQEAAIHGPQNIYQRP
jgi:hypothetical protein